MEVGYIILWGAGIIGVLGVVALIAGRLVKFWDSRNPFR